MACLTGIKLLSTWGKQSCCLCPHMKYQRRLESGRDGHAQDIDHQPSSRCGIFSFWISMDSVEQIHISNDEREMRYYIQTKGGKCIFLSANYLLAFSRRGWRGKKGYGEEGKGKPQHLCPLMTPQAWEHTTPFSAQHPSAMALGTVAPMLQISLKATANRK